MRFIEPSDTQEIERGFVQESEVTQAIKIAMCEMYDSPELTDEERVVSAETFKEAKDWFPTLREGLVVKLADGSVFEIIVKKVN